MKLRFTAMAAALLIAAVSATACGDKKSSSSGSDIDMDTYQNSESSVVDMEADFKDVQPVADSEGALLSIIDTTAKAGETAEVTVHVENAEMKWNMCGFHVTYPDVLTPKLFDPADRSMEYKKGPAVEYAKGFVSLNWEDNLPDELIADHRKAFFITSVFDGDQGMNGDIATFYFDVPADAASGTVYELNFFYWPGAVFSNAAKDPGYDKYAFEHWTGGTITVE